MGLDADSVMMLRDVVDHHPVNAILSGHAHRMIVGRLADTPVVVAPSTAYEFGPLVDGRQTSRMADPQFLQHSWNSDGSGFLTMLETVSNQPWRTPD